MSKFEVSPKDEAIFRNMSWLVGKTLSYIDATVDCPDASDKYSKREVLKKLFEEQIYNCRNKMFELDEEQISKNIDAMFKDLHDSLQKLIVTTINNEEQRKGFMELIDERFQATKDRLLEDLSK